MKSKKQSFTMAVSIDLFLSFIVFVILVGVTSQPDSGAIPAGIFILPLFLFSVPWTIIWLIRTILSNNLSTKERFIYEILLILTLGPYIWWLKIPGS